MARWIALSALVVALVFAGGLWVSTLIAQQNQLPERIDLIPRTKAQWLGAGSCGSTACHNSNAPSGQVGSEYVTWIGHDLHAKAYQVLHNKRSHDIVEKLGSESRGLKPYELGLCLNCHVHRDYDLSVKDHHPRFSKEDGVSCESCHGPASEWIGEHYKTGWSRKGMLDTRSMTGRVQSCTPCHVGAAGMEVNHDLIAAGHPRLAFEFSAYHSIMPHHWQDKKDKVPGESERARLDWDAAAWFVGQVVTSQAAMELLSARKIWPEFAEYDCYACHHQLEGKSWRQEREINKRNNPILGKTPRAIGSLPWSDWYVSPLPYLLQPALGSPTDSTEEFAALKSLMESSASPDRQAARSKAEALVKSLSRLVHRFSEHEYNSKELEVVLRQLAERGASREAASWDQAAQGYLAFASIHQTLNRSVGNPAVRNSLIGIRNHLQFAPQVDSPSSEYTPTELLKLYQRLRSELTK